MPVSKIVLVHQYNRLYRNLVSKKEVNPTETQVAPWSHITLGQSKNNKNQSVGHTEGVGEGRSISFG